MATVTSVYHRKPYAAIDPTAAVNSQSGRTVLITGSTSGIGLATAKAFLAAHASTVIITGRRAESLATAMAELQAGAPNGAGKVLGRICDVAKAADIEALWEWLEGEGIAVDVLVSNAGLGMHSGVLLQGTEPAFQMFETNVFAGLRFAARFLRQGPEKGKILLNVSTAAVHFNPVPASGAYSASKAAMASLFQHLADERPKDEVKILNIHPGAVLTDQAIKEGYTKDTIPWDSVDLPACFLVWAATAQADFLHGRFMWANWDIGELEKMRAKIEADDGFLKIGLQGIPPVGFAETFRKIGEMEKMESQ